MECNSPGERVSSPHRSQRAIGPRALAIAVALFSALAPLIPSMPRAAADPWVTDNADGTSTAVWNFSNPADYTLTNTSISGGAGLLQSAGPGGQYWNSTTAGDFAGPDSATNVDFASSPGDVMLTSTSGPSTLLQLQPGDRKSTRLNSSHGYISYAP